MLRICLFLITNLSIMLIIGIFANLIGIQSQNILGLILIAGLFGFSGALISLVFSKKIALQSVGGEIIRIAKNSNQQWLLQTVYNQSRKIGIKTPDIAVYSAVDINAFATGATRNSSLIAVSTGLLHYMNKEEAEAVIAHEISHISNGDMVTMTLLQGVINTFVIFLSRIIAKGIANIYFTNKDSSDSNVSSNIYFFTAIILELMFGLLASIITMWFSRYREFRADAGSAKLVGVYKIISALQKLKTSYEPKNIHSIIAFRINGQSKSILNLFLSHPPLDTRIKVLYDSYYL